MRRFATPKELQILRLLMEKPTGMYGLEIVRASEGALSRGTVYVMLGRMEEDGLVRSKVQKDATHAGLARPLYTVTALGERTWAVAVDLRLQPAGA